MTDEQLYVYAGTQIAHFKKISKAVAAKQKDSAALSANGLSDSTTTEVIAAHDALILDLYNSIPTEQEAKDALATESLI